MSHHIATPIKPMQWLKAMVLLVMLVLAQGNAFAQATVTFFHNDIAGTPLAATDSAGNLLWKETYRPYGDRLTHSPASNTNSVWFTSKPQDPHTGLVYMGARYYDPTIGRFMGTDPVGFVEGNVHSVNRYAYANNNPYRYVDPDGRQALNPNNGYINYYWQLAAQGSVEAATTGLRNVQDAYVTALALAGPEIAISRFLFVKSVATATKGTLEGANYAQKTFNSMFSKGGKFAGKSVDDVAGALRSGAMKPSEVPIDFIVRDGKKLILNTRSSQALEAAGIPRSQWHAVNRTGQEVFENMLSGQLQRNGLTSKGIANVRRSGGT